MAKREKKPSKITAAAKAPRTRKLTKKQAKSKVKKAVKARKSLPSSFNLVGQVYSIWRRYWRPLGGIVLVYLILNVLLAGALSNLKSVTDGIESSHFSGAVSGLGSLIGAGTSNSQTSSVLQSLLLITESLVIIWALRHLLAGHKVGVKEAYYHSTTPFIQFLLVIFVIIIQLLPITVGATALGIILTGVFTNAGLVTFVFGLAFILLAGWSVYMLTASIFALYIVTLPDVQPLQALRSARKLVHLRRLQLMRRLIFLPIFITVVMGLIVVPLILWLGALVVPVYFILSMLAILFAHSYLYSLYRSMLE